ncbi:right-handed parallel beta-helix repeat-containing protein [Thermochromatium tepidum]|uniref:Right handed beta helix domain-containing protein n=1 Tax=Thermochromatium tepidum ATCC 43061 TaxID=316276 RepID=A0A6I6E8Q2_THETI|nr:right-handed parallel beta-helix repeat-containing protein [Thermochromatium tepidum]QGU31706.1 hypothetical protein E6P07_01070 [Thermochromatium tepidum ATCC 43061]
MLLLFPMIAPQATDYYVSTTGNDRTGDGSAQRPWRTIGKAAAQPLLPGDQVLIAPGVYAETLALTRSGAAIVPVTTGVSIQAPDRLHFPPGTDLSGIVLPDQAGQYWLYVYRSWQGNSGVWPIVATGSDAHGPWVQVSGARLVPEVGQSGDPTRLSAAVGRPIRFRNAAADPAKERVVLDASTLPREYTMLYIGEYLDEDDAEPVDWNLVDGLDLTGSHRGGGVHIQDSSFNVIMNSRIYDLNGAGVLIAGHQDQPARYNMVWNNAIWNTPDEAVYVGAGDHGPSANHALWTHVLGNDITTQGKAANARLENAIDLKEYNRGDLVAGNRLHDFDLISPYNGAIDIRDNKRDVLIYNNVLRNIGKVTSDITGLIYLYADSDDVWIFNNLLIDTRSSGAPVYAFLLNGSGNERVVVAHNSVYGLKRGLLLEHDGGKTDVRIMNNLFDFQGGILEWGNSGRFTFSHNLYTQNPGAYASEPGRLIADPLWSDPKAFDLRVRDGSPAIDSAVALAEVARDITGQPRPVGRAPDRGAYEFGAAAPSDRKQIFGDGFEQGLRAWSLSGSVKLYSGNPKRGRYAMQSTGGNVWVERDISTAGYDQIELSLWVAVKSFEDWESLILYWFDGETWHEPAEITNTHPAAKNKLMPIKLELPTTAANNPDFKLAFGMWNTDRQDFGYIDDVQLTGRPIGGGS